MFSKYSEKEICVYFIGQDNGLFEKLFQGIKEIKHENEKGTINLKEGINMNLVNNNIYDNYKKKSKKKLKKSHFRMPIKGFKYLNYSKENIFDIYKCIESNKNKKNIIIRFENTFIKEFNILNNKLETDKPFILFCFSKPDDYSENMFHNYKFPQYISYLISCEEKEPNKYHSKIISYILEKGSYYNEEGNKYNKFLPYNFFYKEPKGFLHLNILLTGESRAGKSCFINRISNKLISFESSKFESSTLKINSYEYYPPEEENENSVKKGYGGIKIFDTPGLVKKEGLNSFELIKKKLNSIFDKIHIIYFFIKAQSNLEQCIDMLRFIEEKNINRKKNNLSLIPIIFIKNGEELKITEEKPIIFQELKKQLQKNNLLGLYDNSINQNNSKKEYNSDNIFDDDEDNNNNYDNYIEGNIIQIHIPTGKNINKIFTTTKEYIIRNNNMLNNDLSETKNDVKKLINFYIIEKLRKDTLTKDQDKEYNTLYKKCKDIVNDYKNKCSLLYNLDILNEKSKILRNIGFVFGFGFLCLFFLLIPMLIAIHFIFLEDANIINYIALLFGFGEEDIYEYGLNEYIYTKKDEKEIKEENKEFPIEKFIEKNKNFFKDIMFYIGPIQCLLKSQEMFTQIINLLNELGNRKEEQWNKFQVEKI